MTGSSPLSELIERAPELSWLDDAACRDLELGQLSLFFVEAGRTIAPETKALCRQCPVRRECSTTRTCTRSRVATSVVSHLGAVERSATPKRSSSSSRRPPPSSVTAADVLDRHHANLTLRGTAVPTVRTRTLGGCPPSPEAPPMAVTTDPRRGRPGAGGSPARGRYVRCTPDPALDDLVAVIGQLTGRAVAYVVDDLDRHWCTARTGDLPESWGPEGPGRKVAAAVAVAAKDGRVIGHIDVFGDQPLAPSTSAVLGAFAELVGRLLEERRPGCERRSRPGVWWS